jgi:hypothetical protein
LAALFHGAAARSGLALVGRRANCGIPQPAFREFRTFCKTSRKRPLFRNALQRTEKRLASVFETRRLAVARIRPRSGAQKQRFSGPVILTKNSGDPLECSEDFATLGEEHLNRVAAEAQES